MTRIQLKVKRLVPEAQLPTRAYATDSGLDVFALERTPLHPRNGTLFRLGIAVELPPGYELQLRPRSSISVQNVLTHFGTIDQGYRGEIGVLLTNLGFRTPLVNAGERIAQLVVAPIIYADVIEVEELAESDRGANGFGSSGV